MNPLRFCVIPASLFALGLTACSPSESPAPAPTKSALTNSAGSGGSSGVAPSASASASAAAPPGPAASATADNAGPCAPLIGKWEATFDPDTQASGDLVPFGPMSLDGAGKLDFTLTHDDADLPNVVDFVGTAIFTVLGQTETYQLQPATKATGDAKDTTCDGGLHIKGATNAAAVGDMIFTMDGDFDGTSPHPTTGQAKFTFKTADDDGKNLTATGTAHLVRQQ
jgi:hypothetical protein